jgi:hypothetical protein
MTPTTTAPAALDQWLSVAQLAKQMNLSRERGTS